MASVGVARGIHKRQNRRTMLNPLCAFVVVCLGALVQMENALTRKLQLRPTKEEVVQRNILKRKYSLCAPCCRLCFPAAYGCN